MAAAPRMNETRVGKPSRVLVVEDEDAARATLVAILDAEFEVESVADARAAKKALEHQPFHVVVTDYDLATSTGTELLDALRSRFPGVTGILVTGYPDSPEVLAAKENWQDFTVLVKPYDPETLLLAVRGAVAIARVRQAAIRLAKTQH